MLFAVISPRSVATLEDISPRSVATLAVIEPLMVDTLDVIEPLIVDTLPEISPRSVATLAEILVLITELADAALAVIELLIVYILADVSWVVASGKTICPPDDRVNLSALIYWLYEIAFNDVPVNVEFTLS